MKLTDKMCAAIRKDLMTFTRRDLIDFIIIETPEQKLIDYASVLLSGEDNDKK